MLPEHFNTIYALFLYKDASIDIGSSRNLRQKFGSTIELQQASYVEGIFLI